MKISRQHLRRIIREQLESELGPSLEGITMPGYDGAVWTAYWEYPGYVQLSHPDLDVIVSATPNLSRNNVIDLAIDTHDGENLAAWDVDVRWTGDFEKDKQLWHRAVQGEWAHVEKAIDEWMETSL